MKKTKICITPNTYIFKECAYFYFYNYSFFSILTYKILILNPCPKMLLYEVSVLFNFSPFVGNCGKKILGKWHKKKIKINFLLFETYDCCTYLKSFFQDASFEVPHGGV